MLVERRDAGARVEQQQRDIGLADRLLGLLAHAGLERLVEHILQAGGVDHGEVEVAEMPCAEAPVARHARLVVHQRQLLADQAVEQGRLADIRPADDGDGEGHDCPI
jgi:hypothetical protein